MCQKKKKRKKLYKIQIQILWLAQGREAKQDYDDLCYPAEFFLL